MDHKRKRIIRLDEEEEMERQMRKKQLSRRILEDEDSEDDDGSFQGEDEEDDSDEDDEEESSDEEGYAELVPEDPLSDAEVEVLTSATNGKRRSRKNGQEEDDEGDATTEVVSCKPTRKEELRPFGELGGVLEVIINAKRVPGVLYAYTDRFEFWADELDRLSLMIRYDDLKSLDFFEKLTDEGKVEASSENKSGTKYKFELCIRMTLKSGLTKCILDSGTSDKVVIRRLFRAVKEDTRGQAFHRTRLQHLSEFEAFVSKVRGRRKSRFPVNIKSFGIKAQACGAGAGQTIRDFQELRVSKKEITNFASKHSLVLAGFDRVVFRNQGESVTMVVHKQGQPSTELKSISQADEKKLRQWLKDEFPKVPVYG